MEGAESVKAPGKEICHKGIEIMLEVSFGVEIWSVRDGQSTEVGEMTDKKRCLCLSLRDNSSNRQTFTSWDWIVSLLSVTLGLLHSN